MLHIFPEGSTVHSVQDEEHVIFSLENDILATLDLVGDDDVQIIITGDLSARTHTETA